MYYVGEFFKSRGRFVEECKGYLTLDMALRRAERLARKYVMTRVRDESGRILMRFDVEGYETPECHWDALSRFADGVYYGQ